MSTTTPNGDDDRAASKTIMSMISALDLAGQTEVHRALTLHIAKPAPQPLQDRWRQLGCLAEMLAEWSEHNGRWVTLTVWNDEGCPIVGRSDYDAWRADQAPPSHDLVAKFGNWLNVCRAAYGLLPDGRWRAGGRPWAQAAIYDRGKRLYTKNDTAQAVRDCALALGRIPSTTDYYEYRRLRLRRLPDTLDRQALCLPTLTVILKRHRHWKNALAAAAVSEQEIVAARQAWLPARAPRQPSTGETVGERLATMDDHGLLRAGLTAAQRERLVAGGVGTITVSRAITLAHLLDGSLDWLVGTDPLPGAPVAVDAQLSGAAIAAARRASDVPERTICRRLKITTGDYRRLLRGTLDPSVSQLHALLKTLGTTASDLIKPGDTDEERSVP
jgi:hypothetical protein